MPWFVTVYELLLQVSLAGCVLLALASIAVMLLREPARKIRVIELTMLGLLALPLVALIPGYPRVALLPAASVASEERIVPREMLDAQPIPAQPPALPGGRATVDPIIQQPRVAAAPRARVINHSESSAVASPTSAWQLPTDYRFWIVFAYLTGVGILCVWSLVGLAAMRRLVHSSQPADHATRSVLGAIAGDASDRVRLLVSPRAAQPCAFGWYRPMIVLPETLIAAGDSAALRFALAHEWSHVTRGDIGTWTLSGLARLLHFHQPLVWLLRQHLRRSQDYLADSAAAGTATPEDYAEFLTSLPQNFKRPHLAPGLGIVSRRSDLHRRVVMLVEKQGSLERVPPKRWNVTILIAGLLAIAAVASLRAESRATTDQQTQPTTEAALQKAASNDKIPVELRPERIRETARKYQLIELVVQADPVLRELRQQRDQFIRQKNVVPLESITPPGDRTPRYQIPNAQTYVRPQQLEQRIRQRESEVRLAAQQSLAASRDENEMENVLNATLDLDPVIAQLKQELNAYVGEEAAKLRSDPVRDAEWEQRAKEFTAEHDRKIKSLNTAIEKRRDQLRPGVMESLEGRSQQSSAPSNSRPITRTREPFSGKIRPGDILNIEIFGGPPVKTAPPRTVEPDGNVAIGAAYGDKGRIQVAGKSLIEAGEHIEKELRTILKDPNVIVTYAGHDPDIVAEGEADKAADIPTSPAAEPVVLAPLDTIEVRLGAKSDNLASVNGTYVIEPDGLIGLFNGRLKLASLTELEAGNAIRTHFSQSQWQRKAPPSINVVRRGRAVFPAGKQPAADYRVRAGGLLLVNQNFSAADGTNYEVSADGMLQSQPDFIGQPYEPVHVAGLTLDEVQKRLCENWKARQKSGGEIWSDPQEQAWVVTIGGWHEEADPALIDRLGESADPRVQQLERELQQIKTMIHAQQR